jgi:hypothetical protein
MVSAASAAHPFLVYGVNLKIHFKDEGRGMRDEIIIKNAFTKELISKVTLYVIPALASLCEAGQACRESLTCLSFQLVWDLS